VAASVHIVKITNRLVFSAHVGRLCLWWGGAVLAIGTFARITRELIEGEFGALDRGILLRVAKFRTPSLTRAAIDVTALGSTALVILLSAFALLVLLAMRDRRGALQLLLASAGAAILTFVTKNLIERVRPVDVTQLVVVSGFSYPSGHSVSTSALYLTIAIIGCRYVQRASARATMVLAAFVVSVLVAASRVYLGVHYATDVLSGLSLGVAWALLLTGLFTRYAHRRDG
jgi:undecaprenyl-diphosphatase